jgi:tetratricopeptide (TPR) repeat protein
MGKFRVHETVDTPYGHGKVKVARPDGSYEIIPTSWRLANNCEPVFFMKEDQVGRIDPPLTKGSFVDTAYGEATVTDIRSAGEGGRTNMVVCRPIKWVLAGNCKPTFYLMQSAVSISQRQRDLAIFEARMAVAVSCKEEGGKLFSAKLYEEAKEKYFDALKAMEGLGADLSNASKAYVFEVTVPCHNNIACCSLQSKNYADAVLFGTNGLRLVTALDKKTVQGSSAIWDELIKRGVIRSKEELLKNWKRKSLYYIGKAQCMLRDYDEAVNTLNAASGLLANDPKYTKEFNIISELINHAKVNKKQAAAKEKSKYQKTFKKMAAAGGYDKNEAADSEVANNKPSSSSNKSDETPPILSVPLGNLEEAVGSSLGGDVKLNLSTPPELTPATERGSDIDDNEDDKSTSSEYEVEEMGLLDVVAIGVSVAAVVAGAAFFFMRSRR